MQIEKRCWAIRSRHRAPSTDYWRPITHQRPNVSCPSRLPIPLFLTTATTVSGCLGLLLFVAGCRSETRTAAPTPPPPPPPPQLALFAADGTPLKDGSILEALVTEAPGDHMTIKGEMKMTNTGGPLAGPIRAGWRLPVGFVPWKKATPSDLPVGNEFAYEISAADFEGIAGSTPQDKKRVPFHCDLEPGLWLPPEIPVEYYLKREQAAEDLFHVHLRLRPQWPLSFQPEGYPAGPTKVQHVLSESRGETAIDIDWTHSYKFVNRGHSSLGALTGYRYLKARDPFEELSPALPLVVTARARSLADGPSPNPPRGFSVALPWQLGSYVIHANRTSEDWTVSFLLGRGGYAPPGQHEVALEMYSRGATVHRSIYTIDVPRERPFPTIELLDDDGQPLVPGSRLPGLVQERTKGELPPTPDAVREIVLTVPIHVVADNLRRQDQLADVPNDLKWVFLVSDALHPRGKGTGGAGVFEIKEASYYAIVESGNLAALADGKPHDLELHLPLDPKLLQPKDGQPGLWIQPGVHHVRLLAVSAKQANAVSRRIIMGLKPERTLFLLERDFELDVRQVNPIESAP